VLDEEPSPELAAQVMMEPYIEFPFAPVEMVFASPGALPLPDPPVIPPDDGDLE
jgi:hypothetical protein